MVVEKILYRELNPVEEVTIKFTGEEAELLMRMVGSIGGGYVSPLTIGQTFTDEVRKEIRDKVNNPLYHHLNKIFNKERK